MRKTQKPKNYKLVRWRYTYLTPKGAKLANAALSHMRAAYDAAKSADVLQAVLDELRFQREVLPTREASFQKAYMKSWEDE